MKSRKIDKFNFLCEAQARPDPADLAPFDPDLYP